MKPKLENRKWLESIAEQVQQDAESVEQILSSYQIQPSPVVPAPKRLLIRSIFFSGDKGSDESPLPFEFRWEELSSGFWAILSDKNLRGKSTVLEVIRWMLRGRPADNLQADVRSWIKQVRLGFDLEETSFEIEVSSGSGIEGRLSRYSKTGNRRTVNSFGNEDEFEDVMSNFFMHEFRMETLPVHRSLGEAGGKIVQHGWQVLSSVLFIGTDYKVLVGELPPESGLPIRLTQMYLGVPWVSTLSSIKAVIAELNRKELARTRLQNDALESVNDRIKTLNTELDSKKQEWDKLPTIAIATNRISDLTTKLNEDRSILRKLDREIIEANSAFEAANNTLLEDRRDLQNHVDATAADGVFRALEPSCCPRCEHSISKSKKELESTSNACSLCGEAIHGDVDAAEIERNLRHRLEASKQAKSKSASQLKSLEEQQLRQQESLAELEATLLNEAKKFEKPSKRNELAKEIAVLEARIEEAGKSIPENMEKQIDLVVLEAALVETESRVKAVQEDILTKVSQAIVKYANRFGMINLTSATLRGNLSLILSKGDEQTSYSKVTAGEKLRLKVATVLAMISVGTQLGVGRYPGLLVIDSPAAQEVTATDLAQLMAGLQEVALEHEQLQVFIASIASEVILDCVKDGHTRRATGDDYLW
ncbi:MAG: hypothetical protein K9M08_06910 [Pirellula sp.]|nr:hypothetical protein [Pirellula sp.]